jgi:hypothetical protein
VDAKIKTWLEFLKHFIPEVLASDEKIVGSAKKPALEAATS